MTRTDNAAAANAARRPAPLATSTSDGIVPRTPAASATATARDIPTPGRAAPDGCAVNAAAPGDAAPAPEPAYVAVPAALPTAASPTAVTPAAASPAAASPATVTPATRRPAALAAAAALAALALLCVAWEWWIAPLRPGGTALVLKALPLALALPGVLRRRLYTLQWASMLVLFYLAEGIVRGMSDRAPGNRLGWIEAALAAVFFACALAYVAPFKRAARRARRRDA